MTFEKRIAKNIPDVKKLEPFTRVTNSSSIKLTNHNFTVNLNLDVLITWKKEIVEANWFLFHIINCS